MMKQKMQNITGWILFIFRGKRNAGWAESMWRFVVS